METRYVGDREAALLHLNQLIERARTEAERLTSIRNDVIADLHASGLTQDRLAAAASVSQPYIARIVKSLRQRSRAAAVAPLQVEFATPVPDMAARLATARVRRGLEIEQLARAAGVDVGAVTAAESGDDIPVSVFTKIAEALGKSAWLEDFESLEPTPGERMRAVEQGVPLPVDQGRWHTGQLAR